MKKEKREKKIAKGNRQSTSGDDGIEDPPVPIPNTEVKLNSADGTWRATARESRTLPDLMWLHGQAVKTPPFHGGNAGSIPARVTIHPKSLL